MKLATFESEGRERVGIVIGERLIDLSSTRFPDTMVGIITAWPQIADALSRYAANTQAQWSVADVHLKAPVPRPRKILAIGLNYADHIAETGIERPKRQVWFAKMPSAVNGPFDPIEIPIASDDVDYEAELVFVVGRTCRHVPKERAHEVVFGYCAGNDVSVRDWQMATSQWILGKSFDTHAPFGPVLVTADEIGDPHALGIRCFVNGEMRQNSNTRELVFNVFEQIAHLTEAMTLEPGDIVFTGTPGGVGLGMKPPRYLTSGDIVRVEIDKIGALEARLLPERNRT